ncbi:hypothetical protein NEF10_003491 [Escherichia coli]|nr:hypothetical protein [Escherichia coli]
MQQTLNFDLSEQPIPVLLRGDKWDSVWSELTDNEDLNFVDASRGTSLSSLITSSVESIHTALCGKVLKIHTQSRLSPHDS